MKPDSDNSTPGPWYTGGTFNPRSAHPTMSVWGPTAPGAQSGECVCTNATIPNARLIAASPDLLEALEGVLRVADRATVEFDAARAAIKKAKARS